MRAFAIMLLLGPAILLGACTGSSTNDSSSPASPSNPASPTSVAAVGSTIATLKPDISFVNGTWCGNPIPQIPNVALTGEFAAQSGRRFTGTILTGTSCGNAAYDSCNISGNQLPNGQWSARLTCNVSGTCQSSGSVDESQTTITGTTTCVQPSGASETHQFTLVKQ